MEFRVLGPVEAVVDGRRLEVGAGRQRALLAFLLMHANRVVSADRILAALWGDRLPESGVKTVAFHVSRLRDSLEPTRRRGSVDGILSTEPEGYVLRVEPERIDAVRFERLAREGRADLVRDPESARERFGEALALWHGDPYADETDEEFAQPEIRRLEELHVRVTEDRLEADLALGRDAELVDELEALVTEHPLRERLRGELMLALYRAGRQAEALRVYGEGRQALADELGIDAGPELQQLEGWILRQDPRLEPPARRRNVRNPYKGLRPFAEEDSPDFFGREALTARLVEGLGRVARASRLLIVVGPSGSGKSSAVRAGLIPALRAGALPGSDRWPIAVMLPGTRPFRELAAALQTIDPTAPPDLADQLARDGGLPAVVAGIASPGTRVVLVIDQFEELYSLVADAAERARFVDGIVDALSAAESRLLVVATLRADFLDHPLGSPGLGELVRAGSELVTPLDRDELERAIVRPADSVGVRVDPGLVTEAITDVVRQPGELPLLQYALTELFERSDRNRLTREGYAAIGGVLGALGRRADDAYAAQDLEGREIVRQVFLRLAAVGETGEPTARRVPRSELLAQGDDPARVEAVVDEFGRRRLLSFDRDAVTGETSVQVAHEALLGHWPRLAGWIDEAREDLWNRRRLADAAADWIHAGREPGFLLSASRLDLFASWAASTDLRLDLPERELLDASVAERRRRDEADAARAMHERALEQRATTRLRALVAVLAMAALVATSLSVVVYRQGETAQEQRAIATGRELAAGAIGNLSTDPRLSLLLAWQAAHATADRGYVVEEAMDALHWSLQAAHVAYPPAYGPIAVRTGPGGARGVMLLAPDRLMALAATAAGRSLTPEECRTYLHSETCAEAPEAPGPAVGDAYTASGIVPVERLASASLAGTRVELVSELPADLTTLVSAFERRTGITVASATGPAGDLEARTASGDLPDMAIVARPARVAALARAGLLVDLSGVIDVEGLRSMAGDHLVGLGTVGADGRWPAVDGPLYGAAFATEAEGLIWYPRVAFERAGYSIPRTWDELTALTARMIVDGRTPWCLGIEAGIDSGASAVSFVEDLMLHANGPDLYDLWSTQTIGLAASVRSAFETFGDLAFGDGDVLGGVASAIRTPQDISGWPMLLDPPGCWLHLAGGADRTSWPAGDVAELAAFPFPSIDPAYADTLRGRAFSVVVFRDRPEVRRFVESLVGDDFAAELNASLLPAGIWPVRSLAAEGRPDGLAGQERELLGRALRAGTFHISAADLLPKPVAAAYELGMVHYLSGGPISLSQVLTDIEASWWAPD